MQKVFSYHESAQVMESKLMGLITDGWVIDAISCDSSPTPSRYIVVAHPSDRLIKSLLNETL